MACPGFSGALEKRLHLRYAKPLTITRQAGFLTLTSGESIVQFELRDWVQ
jgi:hypothetical protein